MCRRRPCEVSTLNLENCANARRIYVFLVIIPLFLTPLGYVESSTAPRPLPVSHLHSCEVSTLYLENCANARRIHVFWVINPLFLTPMGEMVETSTLPQPVPVCCRRSCEVSTHNLENCANARRIYVFW